MNVNSLRDSNEEENERPRTLTHLHTDDILCIDKDNASMVVTASYDGQIAVWNFETGHIFHDLNVNNVRDCKKSQGVSTHT